MAKSVDSVDKERDTEGPPGIGVHGGETCRSVVSYGMSPGRRALLFLQPVWSPIMSLLLKALALKLIAGRTVGGVFGLLTLLLVPLAAVLKFIGLPLLFVLGILGAPVFLILGAIGLPVM